VTRTRSLELIRSAFLPALAALVIANFAGYAILGSNGLLQLGDYVRQFERRSAQLDVLEAERSRLAHKVALLDQHKVDPDYADELVRRELGVVRPDEVVIEGR